MYLKKLGMDLEGKNYKAFNERQEALKKQYSSKNAEKQHSKGKLTAHERINLLFDSGTFEEMEIPERNTCGIIFIEHFVPFHYYMDAGRVLAEQPYIVRSLFESY